ncbi:HPr family phosphocarrier protein [Acidaminobacter sp. JC074]|uniref:HPr family phosphocarrier protein n=1 Tax=Acidaminobacter sp. JC074 TaxID=2530199 RepID=UPI001F113211|nr:HPr family phosphocarrier protein [Acidaminobacter sp. JC074]MCH4886150.1 HPr family phosphocarrier protein [Acidaminobacter sp. JC074]
MFSNSIKVNNQTGIHARPASGIVNIANKYNDDVNLINGDKTANGKSLINILALSMKCGDEVIVESKNEAAVNEITAYIDALKED